MNIIYIFVILNLIYIISCLEINNYTIDSNFNLIINGDGFSFQTLVKFNYQDIIAIPNSYTQNEIQVTLPTVIENCEFNVFNSDNNEISNKLYLTITPTIKGFGNRVENTNLILDWYGQYIWANKDINQFKIEIINNDSQDSIIECNEIKNKSTSFEEQIIECNIDINSIYDIKSKLKAIFTIGQLNFINEFIISTPSIESLAQKDSSLLIVAKDLSSGIQLLDSSIDSIKVFNNGQDISLSCNNLVLYNNDGNIECYIGLIVKELSFNGSLNIQINARGYNSNEIGLNIQPFIYTNEKVSIYPLGEQRITLNYFYYQFKDQEISNSGAKVYLTMNQRVGECENIQIINSNQLECTLPSLFVSIYCSIKISINDVETNSVSVLSYLEPTLNSVEKLNNNQIKINGNNLIESASLSYLFNPLTCKSETNSSSKSLICSLNSCNENCFSACGIIVYNDYIFGPTINYYPSPTIHSAHFYNEYLNINATINCGSITSENYFESDIFAYINGIKLSFTLYESGIFKFVIDYQISQMDIFDIIFSVKGANSTFNYNRVFDLPPTISSSKLINNKFIIDGSSLTTDAKITYLDEELSCISIKNTGDYYSYRLECSIPSKIDPTSINHCGILNYSDKYLKTSFIFLIEPTIYDIQIYKYIDKYSNQSYLSYISVNGTINCNEIPNHQYIHLNLIINFNDKTIPFNSYQDGEIFRFNFVNKKLPIESDKPNFEIYLSNSYYELNSNILTVNNSDIILDNNTITINNTFKLSQSNILNSFLILSIIIIIYQLKKNL